VDIILKLKTLLFFIAIQKVTQDFWPHDNANYCLFDLLGSIPFILYVSFNQCVTLFISNDLRTISKFKRNV